MKVFVVSYHYYYPCERKTYQNYEIEGVYRTEVEAKKAMGQLANDIYVEDIRLDEFEV